MINLHTATLRRLADHRAAMIERLLAQWVSLGHREHLDRIQRHVGDAIPWNVNRYHCTADGATLDLATDYAMSDDNVMHLTVTPTCR